MKRFRQPFAERLPHDPTQTCSRCGRPPGPVVMEAAEVKASEAEAVAVKNLPPLKDENLLPVNEKPRRKAGNKAVLDLGQKA